MPAHCSKMKQQCFTVTAVGLLLLSVTFPSVTKTVCGLCSGCLQIPSALVTGLSRKDFLNEIPACCFSLDITRRVNGYVDTHQFCGLKWFCLIWWLSTGLYQKSIDSRQSLDWSTAINSGSIELRPLLKWHGLLWLIVCPLCKFKSDFNLSQSLSLLKSWLIRKISINWQGNFSCFCMKNLQLRRCI